jgi:hypothetical protein
MAVLLPRKQQWMCPWHDQMNGSYRSVTRNWWPSCPLHLSWYLHILAMPSSSYLTVSISTPRLSGQCTWSRRSPHCPMYPTDRSHDGTRQRSQAAVIFPCPHNKTTADVCTRLGSGLLSVLSQDVPQTAGKLRNVQSIKSRTPRQTAGCRRLVGALL